MGFPGSKDKGNRIIHYSESLNHAIMKFTHLIPTFIAIALIQVCTAETAKHPAYIDVSKMIPLASSDQYVEVNVNASLISMVAGIAKHQEPEVAELISGLKSIRVNVLNIKESSVEAFREQLKKIADKLNNEGWDRIVAVKDQRTEVTVFLKNRGDEAVEGIFVSVMEPGRETVLVNIIGDIRPNQIATIAERFQIDPLKKIAKEINPG